MEAQNIYSIGKMKMGYIYEMKEFAKFFEKSACIFGMTVVIYMSSRENRQRQVGVDYDEGPPVPIPNTEVKLARADNTWLETAREDRFSPTQKTASSEAVFFR